MPLSKNTWGISLKDGLNAIASILPLPKGVALGQTLATAFSMASKGSRNHRSPKPPAPVDNTPDLIGQQMENLGVHPMGPDGPAIPESK